MKMKMRRTIAIRALAFGIGALLFTTGVEANHPVFVEGNCFGPGALQRTIVPAGTCGDYDGDGRIGTAEDVDEADRVFGTINAALGPGTGAAAGTGANQNGRVIIVSSGSFAEVVTITSANGNTQLEGAPGVDANIDAIVQGVAGGAGRQLAPGIIVDAPDNRHVTIRNVMVRNWAEGIRVLGNSHVFIDNTRIENNANWGIRVQGHAKVKINDTAVAATGFRVGAGTDFPGTSTPTPGIGIEYENNASGLICNTCVTRSFRQGIRGDARRQNVCLFDNGDRDNHDDDDDDDDDVNRPGS